MVLFSNTIKDPLFEKRGEKEKKLFTVYGGHYESEGVPNVL